MKGKPVKHLVEEELKIISKIVIIEDHKEEVKKSSKKISQANVHAKDIPMFLKQQAKAINRK